MRWSGLWTVRRRTSAPGGGGGQAGAGVVAAGGRGGGTEEGGRGPAGMCVVSAGAHEGVPWARAQLHLAIWRDHGAAQSRVLPAMPEVAHPGRRGAGALGERRVFPGGAGDERLAGEQDAGGRSQRGARTAERAQNAPCHLGPGGSPARRESPGAASPIGCASRRAGPSVRTAAGALSCSFGKRADG